MNKHGDITIIKGNKQFRMDVKDPGWKFDKNGKKIREEPHFHLKQFKDGKWRDATKEHRHYFKKGKSDK